MASVQQAIAGLQDAIATPLSRNDLGRLAQMHSWGQALAEHAASGNGPEGLLDLAAATVMLLERIILDEAKDPDGGLALLPQAAGALRAACENGAVDRALIDQLKAAAGGAVAAPVPPPAPVAAAPAEPAPPPVAPPPSAAAPPSAVTSAENGAYVSEPLLIDMTESEHLRGFLDESQEHMDAIEAGLLAVEANPSDTHQLNELFRPFHTIKGIAGFLNLRDINRLTHEIETILDLGRKNELRITAGIVDLIFKAVDALKAQLDAVRTYMAAPSGGPCPQPDIGEMMSKLRRAAAGEYQSNEPEARVPSQQSAGAPGDDAGQGVPAATGTAVKAAQGIDHSIRVDTAKLDSLVDAVGELVIAQSMVSLSSTVLTDDKLARVVSQVTKIVRDVQETAMAMRMVPIGQTFQKMRRLVRDVARKAGKRVELVIEGEETELDKNVIQQISDPLVHMVRNAVDHGIEPPELRKAVGKPETGLVTLNAYHQGDSIVIEIRDDGRGLDREKLIAKAIERGIVSPGDELSDQQAFALIFAPGFSTAEVVTDISGRGVGMDVVRRNVEQLRGKIEIQSEKGRGSTFLIKLPLTLAIIDGMLVRVGAERLIIPTILIEQSLRPERRQITSVQKRGQVVQIRGELCPLIQLGALFGYGPPVDPCENQVVVVLCESQKIALVVEELVGQQQVVIKSLGERFKMVRGVSGAAILGDGKVGLILEPSGILALHRARGSPTFEPPSPDERDSPARRDSHREMVGAARVADADVLEAACAAVGVN